MTNRDDHGYAEYAAEQEKREGQARRRVQIATKRAQKAGQKVWNQVEAIGVPEPILKRFEILLEFFERTVFLQRCYPRAKDVESVLPTFEWDGDQLIVRFDIQAQPSRRKTLATNTSRVRFEFVLSPDEVTMDGRLEMSTERPRSHRMLVDHRLVVTVPNKQVDSKRFAKMFDMVVVICETLAWQRLGLQVPVPPFDPMVFLGRKAAIPAGSSESAPDPSSFVEGHVDDSPVSVFADLRKAAAAFLLEAPTHEADGCTTCELRQALQKAQAWIHDGDLPG